MTNNKHYRHSIEQADGLFELESTNSLGDLGDIYLPSKTFTDATVPDSKWWNGDTSGFEVKDIKFVGEDYIQFTVTIPDPHETHYKKIPTDNWLPLEASVHQVGHEAEKAFDGDISTYYHVPWNSGESRPHEIVIYLGDEYLISEAHYQPNDNFSPPWEGRVEHMVISVSKDGDEYEDIGGEFFERTMYNQYIELEPTIGSYVKFSAYSSYPPLGSSADEDPRTSMAEISLRGLRSDVLDVEDSKLVPFLTVFPNPTAEQLNIKLEDHSQSHIVITDIAGKVMTYKIVRNDEVIDVSNYPSGMYSVTAIDGDKVDRQVFVKE